MAIETINIGASANDGTGDTIRDAFDKTNGNFTDLDTTKFDVPSGTALQYVKGDGGLGTFDLETILSQGNRPVKVVDTSTYTFIPEDRAKYIVFTIPATVTLNAGVFELSDTLVFYNATSTDLIVEGTADIAIAQGYKNDSLSFVTMVVNDDTWLQNCMNLVTATDLNLQNVDNTSDLDKPISTATQDALDLKEDLTNKTNTVIGNEADVNKYLSVKGYYDYLVQMAEWLTPEQFYTFIISLSENTTPTNVDYMPISAFGTTKYIKLETLKAYFIDGVIPTTTSALTNNGSDGVNPFITALDIPTTSQASTLVREVKNMTGATLVKGTVVFISGANGNKPLVSKAIATTDALSARTFGLVQSNILNNGTGNCVIIGDLSGLNTSSFTDGDQLYLSGTVAGGYTSTRTLAPTHLVYIGKVTRSHPTLGQIEVQIQNGYELNEIHDVQIISVANNQVLNYDSATSLWKNKTLAKADVGLSNVDNTSDANKPISTATQTALDLKAVLSDVGRLSSDYTLSNVATAQNIFNIGSSGNGSFNALGSTLYEIELFVNLTSLSSTSGFFSFSLAGTATYTDLQLDLFATKSALISGSVFQGVITSASAFQCTTSNVNTVGTIKIKGLINVNGSGTIIPTITLSQASAGVVKKNSYFVFRKIGTSSFTASSNII